MTNYDFREMISTIEHYEKTTAVVDMAIADPEAIDEDTFDCYLDGAHNAQEWLTAAIMDLIKVDEMTALAMVTTKLDEIKALLIRGVKFEKGGTYWTRSPGDANCIFSIDVKDRTDKMLTFVDWDSKTRRAKIKIDESGEYIQPDRYSMAPIYRACRSTVR